ncbi:hypothetical protein, partial [Klebsiella oxytoca]
MASVSLLAAVTQARRRAA